MNFFFVMVKILGPCVAFLFDNVYLIRLLLFHSLNSLFFYFFPHSVVEGPLSVGQKLCFWTHI